MPNKSKFTLLVISLLGLVFWVFLRGHSVPDESNLPVPPSMAMRTQSQLVGQLAPSSKNSTQPVEPSSNQKSLPFYGRIDVKKQCAVPDFIAALNPDYNAMFSKTGSFDSEILKSYGLDAQKAEELGSVIDSAVSSFRSLELTHSRLVKTAEEEYIHVDAFFQQSSPLVEKVKEAVLEKFSEFKDDRGFVFLKILALAPEFSDNGVIGKDIAFAQDYNSDGILVPSFSIKPSGPAQADRPYPMFASGTHKNDLAQRRYNHLFEQYSNEAK